MSLEIAISPLKRRCSVISRFKARLPLVQLQGLRYITSQLL